MTHRFILPATAFLILVAPVVQAVDPSELKPGLVAEYRDVAGNGQLAITRLEPGVALALGPGESAHPRLGSIDSARWAGYINIVRAGKYRFSAGVRNGAVRVSIAGQKLLQHTAKADEAGPFAGPEVVLAGGVQLFEVNFSSESKDGVRLELLWEGPGFRREPVPHMFFGHLQKDRPAAFAAQAAQELGRYRFEELACIRCHKPAADDKMAAGLVDRPGPILTDIAKRAYSGWIDSWLADPKKLRPHTTMPRMFADSPAGRAERYAVVRCLISLAGGAALDPARPPTFSRDYAKSMESGKVLFSVAGCAACHQPPAEAKKPVRNDVDDEKLPLAPDDYMYGVGSAAGPAAKYLLGAVGSKTRPESLAGFLQDPLKTHPAGRMPKMMLENKEALDLARYLCRLTEEDIDPKMPKAPATEPASLLAASGAKPTEIASLLRLSSEKQWVEVGKKLVVSKGCVNCHQVSLGNKALAATALFPSLAVIREAPPGKGCLAPAVDANNAPDYKLDVREASAITDFVKGGLSGAGAKSPAYSARLALKRFNCLNCHQRDGEGGLSVELTDQMKNLEKAENADDIRPPVLTGIGHKSRTSWLTGVLMRAQRARPWMQLRMPQYGDANVGHLPTALAALEGTVPDDSIHKVSFTAEKIAAGRTIVGKGGLGCISCHDISGIPNSGTRGPDLATIDQRVRYDWYSRWLSQPLRMSPGTRMPQAFIAGMSPLTAILHGDAEAQAEAMWAYLSLGPGLPLPDGMEPPKGLTVLVKDRPEIMRTFLKDGGNRAIAVGYPGGVSAAFSADECRLIYAWAGNFLDATPVWDKRGGKPALLLGPKFWSAPPGHPWALTHLNAPPPDFLARAKDPAYGVSLPEEPPVIYTGPKAVMFMGYSLDKYGLPTFRYQLAEKDADLRVAETPTPLKGGLATGLRRTFAIESAGGAQPWLLAGMTGKEPRLIGADGSTVVFDWKSAVPAVPAKGVRVLLPDEGERVAILDLVDAPVGTEWRFVHKAGGGWLALVEPPAGKAPRSATLVLNIWALPKDDPVLFKGLEPK